MSSSSSFSSFVVAVVASLVGCSAEADWSMSIASVADILESNCQGLGCLVSLLSSLHGQEVVTINQYHHYYFFLEIFCLFGVKTKLNEKINLPCTVGSSTNNA